VAALMAPLCIGGIATGYVLWLLAFSIADDNAAWTNGPPLGSSHWR